MVWGRGCKAMARTPQEPVYTQKILPLHRWEPLEKPWRSEHVRICIKSLCMKAKHQMLLLVSHLQESCLSRIAASPRSYRSSFKTAGKRLKAFIKEQMLPNLILGCLEHLHSRPTDQLIPRGKWENFHLWHLLCYEGSWLASPLSHSWRGRHLERTLRFHLNISFSLVIANILSIQCRIPNCSLGALKYNMYWCSFSQVSERNSPDGPSYL